MPTEKANGLQIAQNCEAFARCGYQVELWVARRWNTNEMRRIDDIFAFYGVDANFQIRYLPCIDLMPLVIGKGALEQIALFLYLFTFVLSAVIRLIFTRADRYYTRDRLTAIGLRVRPRHLTAFEVHSLAESQRGRWIDGLALRSCGSVITITRKLAEEAEKTGVPPARILVAHDGIRPERFTNLPDRDTARKQIGWPANAFIVGYVGRLHTMGMDKGVGALIEALRQVDGAALALVGGPDEMAAELRQKWIHAGLNAADFLYAGQVMPRDVPLYLSAFDVCAMPHPYTTHFAFYTSPLKLFEYMASRRPIVASDLPSWADVLEDEVNALMVPPGEVDALAQAIQRLREDPALRDRLAEAAYSQVMERFTWPARARMILDHIESYPPAKV